MKNELIENKRNDYILQHYNILFKYGDYLTFDFNNSKIEIEYMNKKYLDTIILTDQDQIDIIDSFNENQIDTFSGSSLHLGNIVIMPVNNSYVYVYKNNIKISELIINNLYQSKDSKNKSKDYKALIFKEKIEKILLKNTNYKKALDTLKKFTQTSDFIRI